MRPEEGWQSSRTNALEIRTFFLQSYIQANLSALDTGADEHGPIAAVGVLSRRTGARGNGDARTRWSAHKRTRSHAPGILQFRARAAQSVAARRRRARDDTSMAEQRARAHQGSTPRQRTRHTPPRAAAARSHRQIMAAAQACRANASCVGVRISRATGSRRR